MCCACEPIVVDSDCQDTNGSEADSAGDPCIDYWGHEHWCGNWDTRDFDSNAMCCACGGGSRGDVSTVSTVPTVSTCQDDTLTINSTIFLVEPASSLIVDMALPDY